MTEVIIENEYSSLEKLARNLEFNNSVDQQPTNENS